MFYLRLALGVLAFVAASVYGVAIAVLRRDPSRVAHDYAQLLARLMRSAFGMRVETSGTDNLHRTRPCIYIANHQSVFDVPVLAGLYPVGTVVIGKRELMKIPFFGWIYKRTGNVLINRADREQAVGRLKEAEAAVVERGASVWIFPEGTRGKTPGELLPFKKGAFYMAIATGAPLVPVVVSPLKPFFDIGERRIRPATVQVRVLEPIPAAGLTDADVTALMTDARDRMEMALRDLETRPGVTPPHTSIPVTQRGP